jgi:GxxExxY protein
MRTNTPKDIQLASRATIVERELSYTIVGGALEVHNELGFGFVEPIYSRALQVALTAKGLLVEREYPIDVQFRGVDVGRHRIDMLIEHRVVLEIKSTERLSDVSKRQVRNYLKAMRLELGLILHFGPRLDVHRILAPWTFEPRRQHSS